MHRGNHLRSRKILYTFQPKKQSFLWLQPASAWTAIAGLSAGTVLFIAVGLGAILNLLFPLGALIVSIFLYIRYPILYLGFTWWLWFLTPLIRRLADYHGSFTNPSPILLAPLLVTLVSSITLVKYIPKIRKDLKLPFVVCLVCVFYGFLIGLIQNSVTACVVAFLGWVSPICFGFHLLVNWKDYPDYRQNIQRVFVWGVLVMGIYGIVQYLVAPEWDRLWLSNVDLVSFGQPEPLKIRVWSTMNSPQALASIMMPGLLLLFTERGNLRFLSAGAGYLSFLLSLARAGWLSWLIGLLIFIPSLKARLRMRLATSIIAASLLVIPLVTLEPFSAVINTRITSLSNSEDNSLNTRLSAYNDFVTPALSEYVGKGLGNETFFGINTRDSGIFAMLYSLGSIGTLVYLSSIFLIFFNLFQSLEIRSDVFASAARAIALGSFSQIGLNIVTSGILGLILWGFLGMSVAAQRYSFYQLYLRTQKDL